MGSLLGGSFLSGAAGIAKMIQNATLNDARAAHMLSGNNVPLPGPKGNSSAANDIISAHEKVGNSDLDNKEKDLVDEVAFDEYKNARMDGFNKRMDDGTKNKNLTSEETFQLELDKVEINKLESQYARDGKFTLEERKDLEKKMNELNKKIYEDKHNTNGVQAKTKTGGCNNKKIDSTTKGFKEYMDTRYRMENLLLKDGLKDKKLTQNECNNLKTKQKSLKEMEKLFMKDQHLNGNERIKLMEAQDKLNEEITNAMS